MWQDGYEPERSLLRASASPRPGPRIASRLTQLGPGWPGLAGRGAVMAYGEEVAREIPRAFMIHVWPTAELIAESWGWPESWHTAYAQIAWTLGLAAATQVLEGGSFDGQTSEFCPPIGCVRFTIAQAGTTIHITISDFAGPHAPGPNGGIGQQPTTIGGLVLGLREANGYFHVVVFHGAAPEVPASGRTSTDISYNIDGTSFVVRANEVLPVVNYLEPILQSISDEAVFCYIGCDCPDASQDALRREIRGSASTWTSSDQSQGRETLKSNS
jgi:hypothetical protein